MTAITRISITKRGRYALFSGDDFLFSLDEETFARSAIAKGDTLSGEDLLALRQASETRKAKDSALRYLAVRPYARQELYQKLLLKYDEHSAAAALAAMGDAGLMDDAAFAGLKAQSLAAKGKGPREIRRRLLALGVGADVADAAIDGLGLDGGAAAYGVVCKHYMEKLRLGKRQQVMAALARRGFSHSEIVKALSLADAGMEDDTLLEDA